MTNLQPIEKPVHDAEGRLDVEEWRAVSGFVGIYEVSSLGRVRSLPRVIPFRNGKHRTVKGQVLKTAFLQEGGYEFIYLYNGHASFRLIHRLVAAAFLGDCQGRVVNHKDGNKQNNRAVNLEWVSHSENERHATLTGLKARGSRVGGSVLTEKQVLEIKELIRNGGRTTVIAGKYGVDPCRISDIKVGRTWAWL